jgi:hypothetical protein
MWSKIAILVSFLASVAANSQLFYTEDAFMQRNLWNHFKSNYGKQYTTSEEDTTRFGHFLQNLKLVDERNAANIKAGGEAVHGVTQFSDLSQDEFARRYLLSDPSKKIVDHKVPITQMDGLHKVNASLGLVDWTGRYTTGVKNQVCIL